MDKKMFNNETLAKISQHFSKFKRLLEDSTDKYTFFRAKMFSTNDDTIIRIDFVGGDIDGNYKRLSLDFDPVAKVLYYSKNFGFKNESKIMSSIVNIIEFMNSTGISFSTIYFDFATRFRVGNLFPDPKESGSYICYLIGYTAEKDDPNYCLTEAIKTCGSDLAGTWKY